MIRPFRGADPPIHETVFIGDGAQTKHLVELSQDIGGVVGY
jgi:hypothetical protein